MKRLIALLIVLYVTDAACAQREHGFVNTRPSGQPYLSPEESIKRMKVPPGWEVKLFAAEPDVINPIAFTIDERGRVWVVECYEYPSRTPQGKMPRDRIVILEDTDGDGKSDKRTVWAEGKNFPTRFDLASGIEVGHGGVFLGAPPYLWFLQDTDNDGKCDKYEILLKGFGSQDTHETLNTFTWGPDGWLYGLHGVFTHSEVSNPSPPAPLPEAKPLSPNPSPRSGERGEKQKKADASSPPSLLGKGVGGLGESVKINAGVWRYHPRSRKFEVFAEGTSNPWGMDFDQHGNCFLCCCVIPHLFHIVPGGIYIRQAGVGFNPYAYGELKEICDHTHHKESGWAHAGLLIMQGKHVPEEYQNSVLMGSIHGCSIKRDVLRRNGSTFIAGHAEDFLVSGDKNFRPINLRWGPDGSIYVIDWHDQNPCHQAQPDSWDKERGRVYRIQRTDTKTKPLTWLRDAGDVADEDLLDVLLKMSTDEKKSPWWFRTALRLEAQRYGKATAPGKREPLKINKWDYKTGLYRSVVAEGELRTIWRTNASSDFDEREVFFDKAFEAAWLRNQNPRFRVWTVRLLGESVDLSDKALERLTAFAGKENAPEVRVQLASSAQRFGAKHDTLPLLHNLMLHKEDATDPVIPLMIWLAYEPPLARTRGVDTPRSAEEMDWLKENAPGNPLITDHIIPRVMRRLLATRKEADLFACVQFLQDVKDKNVRLNALRGLAEGLKGLTIEPPANWNTVYAELQVDSDAEIKRLANQLAVNFRDAKAVNRALDVARDVKRSSAERAEAVRSLALLKPPAALYLFMSFIKQEPDLAVRVEAARGMAGFIQQGHAREILNHWKTYPREVRLELVTVIRSRKDTAVQLLEAVGKNEVPRTDLTDNTILAIRNFNDAKLNQLIEKVWGRYRQTPEELEKLIAKLRTFVKDKPGDAAKGKLVFEKNCLQCHRFGGQGHEVGPELDGADRGLDYLLANILDPNRVIGQPYYQRVIDKKDGTLVVGLLHAEDGRTVTLKRENAVLEVIPKSDIHEMKTVEKSLMPEGLGNNITAEEFRDLVRYLIREESKK